MSARSITPTPYAVRCWNCSRGGRVYMTESEYERQLDRPDALWTCPACGEAAPWDDANYEERMEV